MCEPKWVYDVDEYTADIARHIYQDDYPQVTMHHKDVVFDNLDLKGNVIINCSCEHMHIQPDNVLPRHQWWSGFRLTWRWRDVFLIMLTQRIAVTQTQWQWLKVKWNTCRFNLSKCNFSEEQVVIKKHPLSLSRWVICNMQYAICKVFNISFLGKRDCWFSEWD